MRGGTGIGKTERTGPVSGETRGRYASQMLTTPHRAEGALGKPKTVTGAERHSLSRLPKDTIFIFTGRDPQT